MLYRYKHFKKSIALVIFLIVWELLPASGMISKTFLSPPSEVFQALVGLIESGELWVHMDISLKRAFIGFALAVITMIP
jgi:NitT/TauT family transport system permease protein